jgi:hypothetical protein
MPHPETSIGREDCLYLIFRRHPQFRRISFENLLSNWITFGVFRQSDATLLVPKEDVLEQFRYC